MSYYLQIENKRHVGYKTGKSVSSQTIQNKKSDLRANINNTSTSESETASKAQSECEYEKSVSWEEQFTRKEKEYRKTKNANKLVTS